MGSKKLERKRGAQELIVREVSTLIPFSKNPRTHSDAQIAAIARSIDRFGFTNPILLDGENGIIAGHGRVLAASKLGMKTVPCIDLHGLTKTEQRAYIIADNQLAVQAGWDDALLVEQLDELLSEGFDVTLTGFSTDAIAEIKQALEKAQQSITDSGTVLGVMDVSLDNPTAVVQQNEIWKVGNHVLVCASVFTGWRLWRPYLKGSDALFCPYPNPLVPLSEKASTHHLVMVQPETYLAGHLIDKFRAVNGDESCVMERQGYADGEHEDGFEQ